MELGRAATAGGAATARGTATGVPPGELVQHAPDGLAVIDAEARFVQANPVAAALCGLRPGAVAGVPSPFPPPGRAGTQPATVEHQSAPGERRELAYVVTRLPGRPWWAVSFRDVTAGRQHQRRLAAIARAASSVASERSLVVTLEALAREVAQADALAGVQVITGRSPGGRLHVMGTAGFERTADFFDRLVRCRARGARMVMLEALERGEPVVVADRYDAVMRDPAWAPLREVLRHPRWDWFASVPLLARGEAVGVLNAFFAPGQSVGGTELDFLLAMAEQAALAVDQAALLERERDVARLEERQRLARDLHDSVVQQVFSMMMQSRSLGVLVERGLPPAPARVAQVADDLSASAEAVLADLRGMVVELRPATGGGRGLVAALRSLLDLTAARTGLEVALDVRDPAGLLAPLDADLVEDVYRVVAEALHNCVKHAAASRAAVRVSVASRAGRWRLVAEVTDDGRGLHAAAAPAERSASGGQGIPGMGERAARWGGGVRVRDLPSGGTAVRLSLPVLPPPVTGPTSDPPEPGRRSAP